MGKHAQDVRVSDGTSTAVSRHHRTWISLVAMLALVAGFVVIQVATGHAASYECDGLAATIVGSPGNDNLTGTPGDDVIVGLGGKDRIRGEGGNDTICGGDGADDIKGGDGNDLIFGNAGKDTLQGGDGDDIVYGGAGNDSLKGGDGDDALLGQGGRNTLAGGSGIDTCSIGNRGTKKQCELETATIIVEKQTDPDGALGTFYFTGDVIGSIADGEQIVVIDMLPGTYTATETDPAPSFALSGIACDDGSSDTPSSGDVATRTATFEVDPEETVVCTFTNTQRGTVEIVKATDPVGGTGFGFTDTIAAPNSFTLDDGQTQTFLNVPPGSYTVTEDDPTPGFDLTGLACFDSNPAGTPSTGDTATRTATINVDPGETVTCTYTNTQRGTIQGLKYEDLNGNGVSDPGEPGLAGVTIQLDRITGPPGTLVTTTDADGEYAFADLQPGTYEVTEVLPAGFVPTTAASQTIELSPGENRIAEPFGNTVPGSVHGYAYEDIDANGIHEPAVDAPSAGIEFSITGTDGLGNPVSLTTTSNADGEFSVEGLLPGTYAITETVPAGHIATTPTSTSVTIASRQEYVWSDGAAGLPPGSPRYEVLVGSSLMFGTTVPGSIHGFAFDDANADGTYDPGTDAPLAGIHFDLTGTDGMGDPVGPIAVTSNADGEFAYVDLLPGVYDLSEIVPSGRVATTPPAVMAPILSRQELVWADGAAMLAPDAPQYEVNVGTDLVFGTAGMDFGDAPDSYATLAASNGARHVLGSPLLLGDTVDAEPDGQPTANADGDDLDLDGDDEDGVTFPAPPAVGSTTNALDVTASAPGLLNAWMDFNGDGDFADAGEQIFTDTALLAGANALTFTVPATAADGSTLARFRFDSAGGLSPTGLAADGEVEDHLIDIEPGVDLDIEKRTNGQDADDPNGGDVPVIADGDPLTWTYEVQNNGTAPAVGGDVVVTDDIIGVIAGPASGDANNNGTLDPGETWVYASNGTATVINPGDLGAVPGSCPPGNYVYENIGTVSYAGSPLDSDPSHYCGIDPPVAVDDSYAAIGNVGITVDTANGLVLGVGTDTGTPPLMVSSVQGASANVGVATATDQGGSVTVAADGSFGYDPPPGFEGADTFSYAIDGPTGTSSPATVSITVSDVIWFVDAAAILPGDGRLSAPFNCLVGTGCFDPVAADDAGDAIYVAAGTYTGGLTLLNGQSLVGEGSTATLSDVLGITPPAFSNPLPTTGGTAPFVTNGTGDGVALGSSNTVRGLTIGDTSGTGIRGASVGSFAMSDAQIIGGGQALDITGGSLAIDLDAVQVTGSTTGGVSLVSTTGSASFGSLNVTTSGTGLNAVNAGTLSIGGATNTVDATGATAINATDTTIGTGGWTFQSVSASGASNGIVLDNTGSEAFSVTGVAATDGSGGTIQNITSRGVSADSVASLALSNMNLTNANTTDAACGALITGSENQTCNAAVHLQSVGTATLTNVTISGTTNQQGINGHAVTNLGLDDVSVTGAGTGVNEGAVRLSQMSGTLTVTDSTFAFSSERNLLVFNNFGGETTLTMSVSNSTFADTQSSVFGADGLEVELRGASNLEADITTSSFLRNRTNGVQVLAQSTGSDVLSLDITGNEFDVGTGIGKAIDLAAGQGATMDFNIIGNSKLYSDGGTAVNVLGAGTASLEGRINDNPDIQTDRVAANPQSGGSGIRIVAEDGASVVVEVDNNGISNVFQDDGIQLLSRNGTGRLDATVNNNSITLQGGAAFPLYGIETRAQQANTVCAALTGNTVSLGNGSAEFRARTSDVSSILYLQGFATDAATTWTNNGNTTATFISESITLGSMFGGDTCATVSNPTP